jgi:hypothetical protein
MDGEIDHSMEQHLRSLLKIGLLLPVLFLAASYCIAAEKPIFRFSEEGKEAPLKATVTGLRQIQIGDEMRIWMGNNLVMGKAAFEDAKPPNTCGSVGIGCEYPIGSCVEHLYGMGPWIGGLINGARYVTEAYNGDMGDSETMPEPKDSLRNRFWTTSISDSGYDPNRSGYYKYAMNRKDYDDDGDGKIDEDELDGLDNDHDWISKTDDIGADGIPDSLEIGCKGIYNAITNPDPAGDNYEPTTYDSCHPNQDGTLPLKNNGDKYTEKNDIPDHGEPHVDEDFGAISDHDVYVSTTDTSTSGNPARHREMGIKIMQKSYSRDDKYDEAILPIDYYFINIGENTITDIYIGFHANMDVGPVSVPLYQRNNYAAYMADVKTAYTSNSNNWGSTPLGITLVKIPKRESSIKYIFQWFDDRSRPKLGGIDSMLYGWMSGQFGLIEPNQSWANLSDSKFLYSFGPFEALHPNDTLIIKVALVSGSNYYGQYSFEDNAENARYPPGCCVDVQMPIPKVKITKGDRSVKLEWGTHLGGINPMDAWDDSNKIVEQLPADHWRRINPPPGHTRGGRIFEGYRLYRLTAPYFIYSNIVPFRQFDLTGDEYGYNVGLDSIFIDSNLIIDKTYQYAITTFGIPDLYISENSDSVGNVHLDTVYEKGKESSLRSNFIQLSFSKSNLLNEVKVVPNPYRVDRDYTEESGGWETNRQYWSDFYRKIKFIHLPVNCTIRIFALDGGLVRTLTNFGSTTPAEVEWNLMNETYWVVASGVYVFTVESDLGRQIGKFVIIR